MCGLSMSVTQSSECPQSTLVFHVCSYVVCLCIAQLLCLDRSLTSCQQRIVRCKPMIFSYSRHFSRHLHPFNSGGQMLLPSRPFEQIRSKPQTPKRHSSLGRPRCMEGMCIIEILILTLAEFLAKDSFCIFFLCYNMVYRCMFWTPLSEIYLHKPIITMSKTNQPFC